MSYGERSRCCSSFGVSVKSAWQILRTQAHGIMRVLLCPLLHCMSGEECKKIVVFLEGVLVLSLFVPRCDFKDLTAFDHHFGYEKEFRSCA